MNEKMSNVLKKIDDSKRELGRLNNEPTVQLYQKQLDIDKKLLKEYELALYEYQENCSHDIWYKIKEETDCYEGRTYYTCKCLRCGKTVEDRDFNNPIIDTKEMYKKVKSIYDELIHITTNKKLLVELINERL